MVDATGATVDAALLDMDMPIMDGLNLARKLRSRPGWSRTPMVLLTSLGSSAATARGTDFCSVLTKPVRSATMRKALLSVLFDNDQGAPAPTADPDDHPATVAVLRVLLAEDNLVNQRVGGLLVSKAGHLVDVVGNGKEAVEAIAAGTYDVVLMDVQMPVMDGLEATVLIRQLGTAVKQPRIIALTANVSPQDRAACQQAGMDDYLPKPLRRAELATALRRVSECWTPRCGPG
jgi:CheY-like chemotaxis protein